MWFSMMEQVRLCTVWPTENWLGTSKTTYRVGRMIGICYSRALDRRCLAACCALCSISCVQSWRRTRYMIFWLQSSQTWVVSRNLEFFSHLEANERVRKSDLSHMTWLKLTWVSRLISRSKPFKYAYEKEIVMYAYFKKLDYFSTECIYSPNAYRFEID